MSLLHSSCDCAILISLGPIFCNLVPLAQNQDGLANLGSADDFGRGRDYDLIDFERNYPTFHLTSNETSKKKF